MDESDADRASLQVESQSVAGGESVPHALTADQQQMLLLLAREAIASYLGTGSIPMVEPADPMLLRPYGVFVTLREANSPRVAQHNRFFSAPEGLLRGCVGRMQADLPLYRAVQEMAVKAATADPRFPPMTLPELTPIRVEISVLSDLSPVTDLDEIRIGVHGLLIEGLGRRGVLLPKVPLTRGWGREEFLENLYLKAGLPSGSWPGKSRLFSFTAIDFKET